MVTGAASGIGKAIALALAAQGMRLRILGRAHERLESIAAENRKSSPDVRCFQRRPGARRGYLSYRGTASTDGRRHRCSGSLCRLLRDGLAGNGIACGFRLAFSCQYARAVLVDSRIAPPAQTEAWPSRVRELKRGPCGMSGIPATARHECRPGQIVRGG